MDSEQYPLSKLLDVHDRFQKDHGIAQVLGDGFLYGENSVYRHIREAALRLGFTYTPQDDCHYRAFSLMALQQILETQRIPYLDNVSVLKQIEKRRPGAFSLQDLQLTGNYLTHESAHGIADHILKRRLPLPRNGRLSRPQQILRCHLGESFANTVEFLAARLAHTEAHEFFIPFNLFLSPRPAEAWLRESYAEIGFNATVQMILFAYLCGNFLQRDLDATTLQRLVTIAQPSLGEKARTAYVQKFAPHYAHSLVISAGFTVFTASAYFKYLGILGPQGDIFDLHQFDFIAMIEKSRRYRLVVRDLAECIEFGTKAAWLAADVRPVLKII